LRERLRRRVDPARGLRPEAEAPPPSADPSSKRAIEGGEVVGFTGPQPAVTCGLALLFAKPPTGDLRWRAPRPPET
jgi:hypothetical protein